MGMTNTQLFLSSFNRPNLYLEVLEKDNKTVVLDIYNYINSKFKGKTGIIYTTTIKDT